jgi:hypothetical protein
MSQLEPSAKRQKVEEVHSVSYTVTVPLAIIKEGEFCYYASEHDYLNKYQYYQQYALEKGWKIYRHDGNNAKNNILILIELRQSILNNEPILIICSRYSYCDEYLGFYCTVKNGLNSKINHLAYLGMTWSNKYHDYDRDFQECSVHDAYSISDEMLKKIFAIFIARRLEKQKQLKVLDKFTFNFEFQFCHKYIHQEIIVYINLEKLLNMYAINTVNSTYGYNEEHECNLKHKSFDDVIQYYKEKYIPTIFGNIQKTKKQGKIDGEIYIFDTTETYVDVDIIKKTGLIDKLNLTIDGTKLCMS